jgi:hypothetical protein
MVKWLERKAGYSTPSGVEVKNNRSLTSISPVFLHCEPKNSFILNSTFSKGRERNET